MSPVEELVVRLSKAPSLLIIEPEPEGTVEVVRSACACAVVAVDDGERAAEVLIENSFDLVLFDLRAPAAAAALKALHVYRPETPVAVTGGWHGYDDILTGVLIVGQPMCAETLGHLFKIFKIRARTREVVDYCAGVSARPQLSGSAG